MFYFESLLIAKEKPIDMDNKWEQAERLKSRERSPDGWYAQSSIGLMVDRLDGW